MHLGGMTRQIYLQIWLLGFSLDAITSWEGVIGEYYLNAFWGI